MRRSYVPEGAANTDNYLALCDVWRGKYLELDREALRRQFALETDGQAHYITYFNQRYRIDQETGMLSLCEDPEQRLGFNTVMTIYHLFYYSKPGAMTSGVFVPFREVRRAQPFAPAFKKGVLDAAAATFDGHLEELVRACGVLGGTRIPQGDAGYRIDAFDCMPLEFLFWDGDDEFPARANILFDADITDFLHEETVVCLGDDLVRRLVEESGLKEAAGMFH